MNGNVAILFLLSICSIKSGNVKASLATVQDPMDDTTHHMDTTTASMDITWESTIAPVDTTEDTIKTTKSPAPVCKGGEKQKCKKRKGKCQSQTKKCSGKKEQVKKGCKGKTCICCAVKTCQPNKKCKKNKGKCLKKKQQKNCEGELFKDQCSGSTCACCYPKFECSAAKKKCAKAGGTCKEICDDDEEVKNYKGCKEKACKCCVTIVVPVTKPPIKPVTKPPVKPVTKPPVSTRKCVCGKANRATRIVGGQITQANEYPWQVALVTSGSSTVGCGGALINDRWVLSAAHCNGRGFQQVLLGNHLQSSTESTERRININRFISHPNYNEITVDHDFALVELSNQLDLESLDPHIRPVCLPSGSNPSQYEDVWAVVSGWGHTSQGGSLSDALRDTTVYTRSNAQCSQEFGNQPGLITDSMICAFDTDKDACQFDSGGPLMHNAGSYYNQIGIVSWGYGCADARYPGVYSRITYQINWIKSMSSSGLTCPPPS